MRRTLFVVTALLVVAVPLEPRTRWIRSSWRISSSSPRTSVANS